jgi:predicted nucleotidyltransferase component of viral defense system
VKKVANLSPEERAEIFSEAAAQKGIMVAAAEKDFWLCWMLMIIFEHPELSKLLKLKGGTSLSKCYGFIDRFSEDIDLILDWDLLTDENPNEERSHTQQDKFNKNLNKIAIEYIRLDLLPKIEEVIQPNCNAEVDKDDGLCINIEYDKAFDNEYLGPEIKLEIGPLGAIVPSGEFFVKSYAAEIFPKQFEQTAVKVVAVKAERTFWDKVTTLHAESFREGDPRLRYSRHYYDTYKMLDSEIADEAIKDLKLLEDVVNFKSKFYYSYYARYDQAKPGTFNLIPEESAIKALKADYENMKVMIFGKYPDFDIILERLKEFESKLNKL